MPKKSPMFISANNKKTFWHWWFLAAAIYLIFAVVVTWRYGISFLMPMGDDTGHHIQLAKNLIEYRTFSLDGLDGAYSVMPPQPTNFLTPGYAFWLALIYLIFKSFTPAIFIGAMVFAFSAPLTYFLAKEITENNKIALWSALIFMIEPLSIYHSGLMFTEQLFVPIFLAACYGFIKYLNIGDRKFVFGSLFIFSLSTLIRPIIFYLLPILSLIVFIKESKFSWRRAAISGILSLIIAFSFAGGWLIRNKIVLNTWQISSNQGALLYGYHYELLMRSLGLNSESPDTGNLNIFSVAYNNLKGEFATEKILQYRWSYLKLHLTYIPIFFLNNGYSEFFSRLTNAIELDKYFRHDLAFAFLQGNILKGALMISGAPNEIFVLIGGILIWFLIFSLSIVGFCELFIKLKSNQKMIINIIGIIVLYFAVIVSPGVVARYRLPINPFVFIFFVSGFYAIKEKIKLWI
ncbi:MAG: hypothetical protein UV53_C0008G0012 [Candidatus Azambacteria bacterium GW2011_GWE1_42_9]|nr:MAG: hypothetical protein UU33_C0001G0235 [Candidatus Azambacteria bacterium GW2011_GWF1_41_10]KKS49268.1 MAG: hypothetical protein UV14_C0001G0013 [Candidatus Azambacteria bacterium GW2011_GWF2_42_22]KKS69375.1 MAG: hypothetical protein UV39_C0012G0003 [Candidatus Azambacteria bacterium GW2011_GWA2_42_62]KKS74224.1 MAG: hypothetical protein UV45_C0009G0010 [Candidatus Azambacteria bacterium GW2011_GWB1_42_72]KKS79379.1 MAG: hypothetical protein UV53_C0008G0012 [Candidatus Azambacteria bacte